MRVEVSIDIDAPVESVFYWIGDPERAMTWMTSVGRTEYIERTPELIGSTFRETVQDGDQSTELTGMVVDFAINKRMAFHLEGDFTIADVVFTLQEENGVTRVTQKADVRFKGLLRVTSLILGRAFKKNIIRQSEVEFAALKALCEQGTTDS